jgi:hypothetical protein
VAYELAEKEVWCIEEQSIFDQVYSLVRYGLRQNRFTFTHAPIKHMIFSASFPS